MTRHASNPLDRKHPIRCHPVQLPLGDAVLHPPEVIVAVSRRKELARQVSSAAGDIYRPVGCSDLSAHGKSLRGKFLKSRDLSRLLPAGAGGTFGICQLPAPDVACVVDDYLPKLKTIGQRVRWARKARGMSQQELADAACLDQTTISSLERDGIENPRKLGPLADALGVPQAWLRFGVANIEKLSQKQVEAMFALADLSDDDQSAVIALIDRLSTKK